MGLQKVEIFQVIVRAILGGGGGGPSLICTVHIAPYKIGKQSLAKKTQLFFREGGGGGGANLFSFNFSDGLERTFEGLRKFETILEITEYSYENF